MVYDVLMVVVALFSTLNFVRIWIQDKEIQLEELGAGAIIIALLELIKNFGK